MKIKILLFFTLMVIGSLACKRPEPCNCDIPEITDVTKKSTEKKSEENWDAKLEAEVEAKVIKKIVDAQVSVMGAYKLSNTSTEQIYAEILSSNPQITQFSNLYRAVAISKCNNICQNTDLDITEKTNKKSIILNEFERNIHKIIDLEMAAEKNQGIKNKDTGQTIKTPGSKERSFSIEGIADAALINKLEKGLNAKYTLASSNKIRISYSGNIEKLELSETHYRFGGGHIKIFINDNMCFIPENEITLINLDGFSGPKNEMSDKVAQKANELFSKNLTYFISKIKTCLEL